MTPAIAKKAGRPLPVAARGPATFGTAAILLLAAANALSMADRQILGILAEPIKHDLGITDQQLGLLIGLSFALFYTSFGLFISRLLERYDRSLVMSACILGWSVATAACGLAHSFTVMLTMRIGVAMGEASCLPGAQAMIADYVPMRRRASAMSMLVAGSPTGVLLGMALGGIVSQHFGWRVAFFVAGAPGLIAALLIWRFVPDPIRHEPRAAPLRPSFLATLVYLRTIPAFWLITAGTGCVAFGIYSQGAFLAAFYSRNHGPAIDAIAGNFGRSSFLGLMLGVILGLVGALGTLLGGQIADRVGQGRIRNFMTMALIVTLASVPFFFAAVAVTSFSLSVALIVPATMISYLYCGPSYASAISLVPSEMRATAAALTLLIVNLIGLGLGPVIIGTLSDHFAIVHGPAGGLRLALECSPVAGIVAALLFWAARQKVAEA